MRYWLLVLLTGWISLAQAGLFDDDELLPADEAYAFSASIQGDTIRAEWEVADGYYLYKDKIRFETGNDAVKLGNPVLPEGKIKNDEFFGDMEVYRGQVVVEVPVTRRAGSRGDFELIARSQGCADRGVCYPPHIQKVKLALAKIPEEKPASGGGLQSLSDLGGDLGFGDDELLPADEAFRMNAQVADGNRIVADWTIAEGYYLYRHQFKFSIDPASGITLLEPQIPEGEHKTDEFFGDIEVYHDKVQIVIPYRSDKPAATEATLVLKYQGCAERGVCYPPITKEVPLLFASAAAAGQAPPPPPASVATLAPDHGLVSEQDAIAKRLTQGNMLATLLAFFGFGLLLAFTPCVFPMVPILSSIIVGEGEHITVRRGFILSLVYVLAMALTYTAAGVFAGLFGENLQAAFQNPWILITFATVFVLLSLSMFGFYDLQMPAFIQSRLTEVSNRQKGGSLTGVAVMGFLSALIVGPCVAAPLAGALIYIGQSGDAVLGGAALFALSMGMGTPLIAIGTGAGKLLPKAGDWMDTIKAVFGVMLLAVAIWMLERVLPPAVTMGLWAALLILSAVYMGALDHLPVEADGWKKFWKGSGVVLLVYGVLLLIGASSGGHDPLQPLRGLSMGQATGQAIAQEKLAFRVVKTSADLDRELAAAKQQGKPVMLDFYADWCVSCKEMERYTFAKPEVQQALGNFVLLKADVTANDEADKALLKRFKLIGPPSILFWDPNGMERPGMRLVGFKDAESFVKHVAQMN